MQEMFKIMGLSHLFFKKILTDTIVEETNRYAELFVYRRKHNCTY
jgi:hypothetical protein